ITPHVYKHPIDSDYFKNPYQLSFFSRLALPFSFWSEIHNSINKKVGCLSVLIFLPLITIMFLPFYFQFVCTKYIILNYWTDWITKISVGISIWLFLITI